MKVDVPTSNFCTTDTALAAYLVSEDFKLLHIDYAIDNKRATFVFGNSRNNQALSDAVDAFYLLKAEGNIATYEAARRDLIRRIKRGLP